MQKIKTKKNINRKKRITKRKKQIKFKNYNSKRFKNKNKNIKTKRKQVGGIMIKSNLEQLTNFTTIDSTLPCLKGRLCLPCSLNSIGINSTLLIDIIQKLEDYSKNPLSFGQKPNNFDKILEYVNAYKKLAFEQKGEDEEFILKNKDIIYLIGKYSMKDPEGNVMKDSEGNVKVLHGPVKIAGANNINFLEQHIQPFEKKYGKKEYRKNLEDALKIVFSSFLNGTSTLLFFYRKKSPKRGHIVGISKSAIHGIPYLLECQTHEALGDNGEILIGFKKITDYLLQEEPEYIGFYAPVQRKPQSKENIIDYVPFSKRDIDTIPKETSNTVLREGTFDKIPIARLLSFEHGEPIETSDSEIDNLIDEQKICMKDETDNIQCISTNTNSPDIKTLSLLDKEEILHPLKALDILDSSNTGIYDLIKAGYIPPPIGTDLPGVFIGSEEKLLQLYRNALIRNPSNIVEIEIIEDLLDSLEKEKEEKEKDKVEIKVDEYDSDELYN